MKAFRCTHLSPGCDFVAIAEDEDVLLLNVAQHARKEHDMFVTRMLIETVKSHITVIREDPIVFEEKAVA
jgi:predicted small metal-binding protein